MVSCAVPGCGSYKKNNPQDYSFHQFPVNQILKEKWLRMMNRPNWTPYKYSTICSKHFHEHCFLTTLNRKRRKLRIGSVPTLCMPVKLQVPRKSSMYQYSDIEIVPSTSANTISISCSKMTSRKKKMLKTITTLKKRLFDKGIKLKNLHAQNKYATRNKKIEVKSEDSAKNEPPKHESKLTEEIQLRDRSVRLKNRKAFLANRRCSVPQCNARPSSEVTLHVCPNNAAVRNEWAEALRVSYHYVKNMVACSLHFMKIDFIQSKNSERVLKHNAVPSRNLPHRKVVAAVKNRPTKKIVPCKDLERQKTMTDIEAETAEKEGVEEEKLRECRACLRKLDDKQSCCNVFQAWAPPWAGMEPTIAEDLAKLANVEISITDRHSKILCVPCYQKLLEAATFASHVRNSDLLLRMRFKDEIDMDKVWPKPIQVDKNINGSVYNNPMEVEIKQEVLSDEEYPANVGNSYGDIELANLDIKIEPEEFVEPPPMNITINGTISLDPLNSENKKKSRETELNEQTQIVETTVKQEPVSEGEQEMEPIPDMPLECLLCMKSFNSVTGLKAHVIAQHSYKTVKRKYDGSVSPEKKRCDKHQCAICRRSFLTSTDLMVHETCHNKHVCYSCTQKFDSFELLSRHRKKCKASINNSVQKLKTLEDVKRPLPEGSIEQSLSQNKESETMINEVDSEIQDVNSEMEASYVNEVSEINEASKINEINEASGNNETSEINEASEINEPSETNKASGMIEATENNVAIDNKEEKSESELAQTVNKVAEIDKTEEPETEGNEAECEKSEEAQDSDTNMKLDLEILSSKSEIESTLDETGMQIETLENDDCI